jgi:hypothetical protein
MNHILPQQRMVLSRVEPSQLLPLLPDLCVRTKSQKNTNKKKVCVNGI